jgi:hypothetical protein
MPEFDLDLREKLTPLPPLFEGKRGGVNRQENFGFKKII